MSAIQVLNVLLEVITSVCPTPPLICSPAHCTPSNANHTLFFAKVNRELHDISHNSLLHLWEHVIDDYCLLKPHVTLNWIAIQSSSHLLSSLLCFRLAFEPPSWLLHTVFIFLRSVTDPPFSPFTLSSEVLASLSGFVLPSTYKGLSNLYLHQRYFS